MTTSDQPHSPPSEFASVFGYLYAQLAVLLVGFALFVLIANLTSLSLYGVIGDAHEVWVHNVRPLVAYPLGLLNAQLPTAWQLGMPTLLIDYVAVGITMVAAIVLCLALLPPFKATLFALQWKHKAREATREDVG